MNKSPIYALGSCVILLLVAGCKPAQPSAQQATAASTTASAAASAAAPTQHGVKLTADEARQAGIVLQAAKAQPLADSVTVTATIQPDADRLVRVAPRVEGRVLSAPAKLGDAVRAGQVLATLDSPALGEASSALAQARASQRIAEADYQRAEALNAEEIIAQRDYLRAKAERDKAHAALRAAEDRMRLLGVRPAAGDALQSTFSVTAPFAGTVVDKKAAVGALAGPADAMFVVADLRSVWIEAGIAESQLARVRVGAQAVVTVQAYPGEPFSGRVTHIGAVLDKATRTVAARIVLPNADGRLKPEMFATAVIDSPQQQGAAPRQAITVPDAAIVQLQGQPSVFVAEGGGYEARAVELGAKLPGRTVVERGLSEGEQVVAAGAYALKARMLKSQIGDEH